MNINKSYKVKELVDIYESLRKALLKLKETDSEGNKIPSKTINLTRPIRHVMLEECILKNVVGLLDLEKVIEDKMIEIEIKLGEY